MHMVLKSDLKIAQTSASCIPSLLLEDDCAHNHASYNCKLSDVLSNSNVVRRCARPIAGKMIVWYPASLCVRKVDVWHNRKMAAYTDRKQNGCSLYKAYGALTKSVIAIDRGPAKCRHPADVSPNSYRFGKYSSGYLP